MLRDTQLAFGIQRSSAHEIQTSLRDPQLIAETDACPERVQLLFMLVHKMDAAVMSCIEKRFGCSVAIQCALQVCGHLCLSTIILSNTANGSVQAIAQVFKNDCCDFLWSSHVVLAQALKILECGGAGSHRQSAEGFLATTHSLRARAARSLKHTSAEASLLV